MDYIAVGTLYERTRDAVVMLHDETENPVDMVKGVEDRLLICTIPIPDDWKPLVGFDQIGADQQTGDKAVKLFQQHRFSPRASSSSSSCLRRRDRPDMGAPIPWQQFAKPTLQDGGDAGERIGEPGLWIDIIKLGGHDQRCHDGCAVGTTFGAGEPP